MTERELAMKIFNDQPSNYTEMILEMAEEAGLIKRCECCNLCSYAVEGSYYGVTWLCGNCRENAESLEDTDEYLRREYERER